MTQPSTKTLKKREIQSLQEQLREYKRDSDLNKLVVTSLLRSPAIYKRLPVMPVAKVPNPHLEICKTEDGVVIMTEGAEMYRVIIIPNGFFDKIWRKARSQYNKIKASWKTKKAE